jgi:hypothetical protein
MCTTSVINCLPSDSNNSIHYICVETSGEYFCPECHAFMENICKLTQGF